MANPAPTIRIVIAFRPTLPNKAFAKVPTSTANTVQGIANIKKKKLGMLKSLLNPKFKYLAKCQNKLYKVGILNEIRKIYLVFTEAPMTHNAVLNRARSMRVGLSALLAY
ncbi:hypothetical protein, partial [Simiduia litorea]